MTTLEMKEDLLRRFYDNTLEFLDQTEPNDVAKRQEILRAANCVFAVGCEKISCEV